MTKGKSVVFASPVDTRQEPQEDEPGAKETPQAESKSPDKPAAKKAAKKTTQRKKPASDDDASDATTQQRNKLASNATTQQDELEDEELAESLEGDEPDGEDDFIAAAATGVIDPDLPTKQLNNRVPAHVKKTLKFAAIQFDTSEQQLVIDTLCGRKPPLPQLVPNLYRRFYDLAKQGKLK